MQSKTKTVDEYLADLPEGREEERPVASLFRGDR